MLIFVICFYFFKLFSFLKYCKQFHIFNKKFILYFLLINNLYQHFYEHYITFYFSKLLYHFFKFTHT